ncbi:hypothetical protein Q4E93_17915 [Flavitalea sp. BT771]|uniref:hypothetical protein n=1 Tax=Flavitalea sp. BT771 TaxID=3063329 RepID=UPI0026E12968|nr:hypothetical protein [Flavitalea sp. BT771]MDO6432486.1 hypothetical protein [Flavitalea sp. BT771]MDV6221395.1 hypothetical protein [Flavitalea sp. BT771]
MYYQDSVVYLFNTNMIPRSDNEFIRPLLFRIKLPAGLLCTYTSGFDAFGFLYPEKQVVFVHLDPYGENFHDTSYRIMDKRETERLLLYKLNTLNHRDQLDMDGNPFDPNRSTWLIKRGKATILLYNINNENASRFIRYAMSFSFL